MKKRILIILFLILITVFAYREVEWGSVFNNTVLAVGDLTIDWGVPSGNPIFVINNMAPGEEESRPVVITNSAAVLRPVAVRGIKSSGSDGLGDVLEIVISNDANDLYGGTLGVKTLNQFFSDSTGINGIPLIDFNPGDIKNILFKVKFLETAGNEYQNLSLIFDIKIGITTEIPLECQNMALNGNVIYGTSGNDRIRGTLKNDLIYGFEGDDTIDGGNGADCIIGGLGNDKLGGGNGNDILLGNEGDDTIDGGNNSDDIFGGIGNDTLEGGNGDDKIAGGDGKDKLNGGNGKDLLSGGVGNDEMNGGNGNDNLQGDGDNDKADGWLGTDTCVAEVKIRCEL